MINAAFRCGVSGAVAGLSTEFSMRLWNFFSPSYTWGKESIETSGKVAFLGGAFFAGIDILEGNSFTLRYVPLSAGIVGGIRGAVSAGSAYLAVEVWNFLCPHKEFQCSPETQQTISKVALLVGALTLIVEGIQR